MVELPTFYFMTGSVACVMSRRAVLKSFWRGKEFSSAHCNRLERRNSSACVVAP